MVGCLETHQNLDEEMERETGDGEREREREGGEEGGRFTLHNMSPTSLFSAVSSAPRTMPDI